MPFPHILKDREYYYTVPLPLPLTFPNPRQILKVSPINGQPSAFPGCPYPLFFFLCSPTRRGCARSFPWLSILHRYLSPIASSSFSKNAFFIKDPKSVLGHSFKMSLRFFPPCFFPPHPSSPESFEIELLFIRRCSLSLRLPPPPTRALYSDRQIGRHGNMLVKFPLLLSILSHLDLRQL